MRPIKPSQSDRLFVPKLEYAHVRPPVSAKVVIDCACAARGFGIVGHVTPNDVAVRQHKRIGFVALVPHRSEAHVPSPDAFGLG